MSCTETPFLQVIVSSIENKNWYQSKNQKKKEVQRSELIMGMKDTSEKIPILENEDYLYWKMKMHLHLLSLDATYVKCIENGPHVPIKLVIGITPDGTIVVDRFAPKLVSKYI